MHLPDDSPWLLKISICGEYLRPQTDNLWWETSKIDTVSQQGGAGDPPVQVQIGLYSTCLVSNIYEAKEGLVPLVAPTAAVSEGIQRWRRTMMATKRLPTS